MILTKLKARISLHYRFAGNGVALCRLTHPESLFGPYSGLGSSSYALLWTKPVSMVGKQVATLQRPRLFQ